MIHFQEHFLSAFFALIFGKIFLNQFNARFDLRTADEDFRNWIGKNKLLELQFLFNHPNIYIVSGQHMVVCSSSTWVNFL